MDQRTRAIGLRVVDVQVRPEVQVAGVDELRHAGPGQAFLARGGDHEAFAERRRLAGLDPRGHGAAALEQPVDRPAGHHNEIDEGAPGLGEPGVGVGAPMPFERRRGAVVGDQVQSPVRSRAHERPQRGIHGDVVLAHHIIVVARQGLPQHVEAIVAVEPQRPLLRRPGQPQRSKPVRVGDLGERRRHWTMGFVRKDNEASIFASALHAARQPLHRVRPEVGAERRHVARRAHLALAAKAAMAADAREARSDDQIVPCEILLGNSAMADFSMRRGGLPPISPTVHAAGHGRAFRGQAGASPKPDQNAVRMLNTPRQRSPSMPGRGLSRPRAASSWTTRCFLIGMRTPAPADEIDRSSWGKPRRER